MKKQKVTWTSPETPQEANQVLHCESIAVETFLVHPGMRRQRLQRQPSDPQLSQRAVDTLIDEMSDTVQYVGRWTLSLKQ